MQKGRPEYLTNFYARRILRIFPLYYAAVLGLAFLAPHLPAFSRDAFVQDAHRWRWWALAYLANVPVLRTNQVLSPTMGHFWSLSVEEQFYLLWPLLVSQASRRGLIRASLLLLVVAFTCRAVLVSLGTHDGSIWMFTPCRMDGLLVGAVVAIALRSDWGARVLSMGWQAPAGFGGRDDFRSDLGDLAPRSPVFLLFAAPAVACVSGAIIASSTSRADGTYREPVISHPDPGVLGKI